MCDDKAKLRRSVTGDIQGNGEGWRETRLVDESSKETADRGAKYRPTTYSYAYNNLPTLLLLCCILFLYVVLCLADHISGGATAPLFIYFALLFCYYFL